jgi:hypothetical protein
LELLVPARKLGTAEAVVLHPQGGDTVAALGAHGAAVVHLGDDAAYGEYLAEPQTAAMVAMIEAEKPDLILFPSTFASRDVAARLVVVVVLHDGNVRQVNRLLYVLRRVAEDDDDAIHRRLPERVERVRERGPPRERDQLLRLP